jgi:hypothetical protein
MLKRALPVVVWVASTTAGCAAVLGDYEPDNGSESVDSGDENDTAADDTTIGGDDTALRNDTTSAGDAPTDTAPPVDTAGCGPHDEDLDGVPDNCDNCPNVVNPTQGAGMVGDACKASPFIPAATRLRFDPFKTLAPDYTQFPSGAPPFSVGTDADSLVGGVTSDTNFRFIVAATGADTSAISATTVITTQASDRGNAGILLRVNGSPPKFLICALSIADGFAAAHAPDAGCTGSTCPAVAFPLASADGGAVAAQAPIPTDIPHGIGDPIGLRATVTKSDTSGSFECRVFNPKVPSTLQSADGKYAVKVSIPSSRWLAAGEVGLYAQSVRAQFSSLDVLRGP